MQQTAYVIISSLFTWPVSKVGSAGYCRTPKWIGSWVALRVLVPQELLGGPARSASPGLLGNLLGSSEGPRTSGPLHGLLHKGPSPPLFPPRAPSPDYFNSHLQPSAGNRVTFRLSVFEFVPGFFRLVKINTKCVWKPLWNNYKWFVIAWQQNSLLACLCDSHEEICWETSSVFE